VPGIILTFILYWEEYSVMAVTTYTIKQLGVVTVGKFFAVFGLVWGFLMGILLAAGLGGIGSMMGIHALGIGASLIWLVIMVIVGGVVGFIGGAIVAIVDNIVLGAMGGIEMDLEVKT
jgi:hypothetical protein